MKKIIILLLFAISFTLVSAQENADLSLEYLQTEQNKAIENENYEAAGKYKKAITLKGGIKEAVADENWDKAAEFKRELNNLNFKESSRNFDEGYYSSNGLKEFDEREFMEGGFFMDGMIGAGDAIGFTFDPTLALNFQLGTKWHFGEGNVYRPGLQMTWLRLGIQKAVSSTYFSLNMYPVNIGYASIFGFTDEIGMEVNLNFGAGLNFLLGQFPFDVGVHAGFHINPNIKFRFNSLAIGFDVSSLNGPILTIGNSTWYATNIYSITIGGKF